MGVAEVIVSGIANRNQLLLRRGRPEPLASNRCGWHVKRSVQKAPSRNDAAAPSHAAALTVE
jgi:hypothetical protein